MIKLEEPGSYHPTKSALSTVAGGVEFENAIL
jgi:hypothetical protein